METNWATEHLQIIRTLMERSAVYRRALAPIMTFTGALGIAAALAGWLGKIDSPRSFVIYWLLVSLVAIAGAFVLVRKQALKASEPFWSPPTRRVAQALLPALTAGCVLSVILVLRAPPFESEAQMGLLPALWIILYGCALHAAGFFMPRGMKLFGWACVMGGCLLFALGMTDGLRPTHLYSHAVMGTFFGLLHLAYGVYLFFTEQQRKNVA